MGHERSQTVEGKGGKWVNIYGPGTPQHGQVLPPYDRYERREYSTVKEADAAAARRSKEQGQEMQREATRLRGKRSEVDTEAMARGIVGAQRAATGAHRLMREEGYKRGGKVKGRGSKDSVKARLTPGEFVVKKSAATKNKRALNAMQHGAMLRKARSA